MHKIVEAIYCKFIIAMYIVINLSGQLAYGQKNEAVIFEASYVSDFVNSPNSNLNTGNAYMGMIDLVTILDTESADFWNGGEFYFHLENTHGATPSADLVGDLQVFSNIDNGDYTYLYQIWYRQSFGNLSVTVGNHDMNSEFVASYNAGEYINSSFGIMPSVSMNVMISSFPKPCLGSVIQYEFSKAFNIKAAIYEGDPLSLDEEPYNTTFAIDKDGGYLSIGEFSYSNYLEDQLGSTYRLGAYYHSNYFADISENTVKHKGNYGLYVIADQTISRGNHGLASFFKFGVAPDDRNEFPFFWAAGLNYYPIFLQRSNDVIGLALASLNVNSQLVGVNQAYQFKYEQVVEWFYKAYISESVQVQADIQYIINTGAQTALNNTALALFRTYILF